MSRQRSPFRVWAPRRWWGVTLTTYLDTTLLGQTWHHEAITSRYPGEPARPLLFTTRATARSWCAARHAQYRDRGDRLTDWRFRPVRVTESWRWR